MGVLRLPPAHSRNERWTKCAVDASTRRNRQPAVVCVRCASLLPYRIKSKARWRHVCGCEDATTDLITKPNPHVGCTFLLLTPQKVPMNRPDVQQIGVKSIDKTH